MHSSFIARPLALEQQPHEDFPHLFIRRLWPELSHGKRVCRLGQLVDLIVIGQFKANFHAAPIFLSVSQLASAHASAARLHAARGKRNRTNDVDLMATRHIDGAISMHQAHAAVGDSMLPVPNDMRVHLHDVRVVRLCKRLVGQYGRSIKQRLAFGFSHGPIIGADGAGGHSWFPIVVDAKNFASLGTGNYRKLS